MTKTNFDRLSDSITGTLPEYIGGLERSMEAVDNELAIIKQKIQWTLEGINIDTQKAGRNVVDEKKGTAQTYINQAALKLDRLQDLHARIEAQADRAQEYAREHQILTARVRADK